MALREQGRKKIRRRNSNTGGVKEEELCNRTCRKAPIVNQRITQADAHMLPSIEREAQRPSRQGAVGGDRRMVPFLKASVGRCSSAKAGRGVATCARDSAQER
jgi:hypothetical protein